MFNLSPGRGSMNGGIPCAGCTMGARSLSYLPLFLALPCPHFLLCNSSPVFVHSMRLSSFAFPLQGFLVSFWRIGSFFTSLFFLPCPLDPLPFPSFISALGLVEQLSQVHQSTTDEILDMVCTWFPEPIQYAQTRCSLSLSPSFILALVNRSVLS